ncbi:MAG: twin-arginine translocase subunit TatC [Bacteroidota bacterium]
MKDLDEKEMTFIDHLEELRWHIIRSLAAILVFAVAAFCFKRFIFHDLILGPSRPDFWTYRMLCKAAVLLQSPDLCVDKLDFIIQSRTMTGQFTTHITVSLVIGMILAFPYAFWEIWRFVKPGLYSNEKTNTQGAVFFVSLLFLLGVLFGYFVLTPFSINVLSNYKVDDSIQNEFDLASYISTVTMLVLSCAIMFQLPMVIYVLSKIGVVTPKFMRHFRRHAIVIILILAAVLTPSPDVLSQTMVAIPIYLLYEISIFVSAAVERNLRKKALIQ